VEILNLLSWQRSRREATKEGEAGREQAGVASDIGEYRATFSVGACSESSLRVGDNLEKWPVMLCVSDSPTLSSWTDKLGSRGRRRGGGKVGLRHAYHHLNFAWNAFDYETLNPRDSLQKSWNVTSHS
jgi:hypothetical protein